MSSSSVTVRLRCWEALSWKSAAPDWKPSWGRKKRVHGSMVLRLTNSSGEREDLSHMLELPSCSHMQIGLSNDNWLFWQFFNATDNKCVILPPAHWSAVSHIDVIHPAGKESLTVRDGRLSQTKSKPGRWLDQPSVHHTQRRQIGFFTSSWAC